MSLQCFAFTFSKAGTVWADDCAKGIGVSSFVTTSSGKLLYLIWSSPGDRLKATLNEFIEEGDQITFVYSDIDNNKVTTKALLKDGVWSTLFLKYGEQTLIQNGLVLQERKKSRPMYQCAQTSTAYKIVFPSSTPPKKAPFTLDEAKMIWGMNHVRGGCDEECLEAKRIYPGEHGKYIIEYENYHANKARATAKRECATAGDIDRCIRIKLGKE